MLVAQRFNDRLNIIRERVQCAVRDGYYPKALFIIMFLKTQKNSFMIYINFGISVVIDDNIVGTQVITK